MKLFDRIFGRSMKKKEPEDIMRMSKVIGPLIDDKINEIFTEYRRELLEEPITYIVPAIWGAKKDGELTETQKEMNRKIVQVIEETLKLLEIEALRETQKFAITYLIRGYMISKIAYMIEFSKNQNINEESIIKDNVIPLGNIEPLGNA